MGGHQSISTGLNRFYIGVMKKSTSMDDGWINTTITVKCPKAEKIVFRAF